MDENPSIAVRHNAERATKYAFEYNGAFRLLGEQDACAIALDVVRYNAKRRSYGTVGIAGGLLEPKVRLLEKLKSRMRKSVESQ
jgi:hypothetical protein